jgi:FAD:protein FMN transferase
MKTRRRFLSILAGASLLPAFGAEASTATREWNGVALGAGARIILEHERADSLIAASIAEIARLEAIFSLYQADSELSRLNRNGSLENPGFEMIELLSLCSRLNARTQGMFDPTIQPLWAIYAESYSAGHAPTTAALEQTLTSVGWDGVTFSPAEIRLTRPGQMLTLNGIAQGYIADKVTALLRQNGVSNVLVNTGEISALGTAPDSTPWQISAAGVPGTHLPLQNAAIATSSPLGTVFDTQNSTASNTTGTAGHILNPATGRPGGLWQAVSVVADTAAEADGLSTAFCLMTRAQIMAAKADAKVYLN